MLSGTSPGLMSRPKPPGSRRSSSSTKQEDPIVDSGEKTLDEPKSKRTVLSPSPFLGNCQSSSFVKSEIKNSSMFERDLDLDLSSDLTDALKKSMQRWPHVKDSNGSFPDEHESNAVNANGQEQKDGTSVGTTNGQHRSTASISSQNTTSDTSLDADWMGELPREELEKLLYESRQIIKERERDLGIAAAIGKALLEKNISLRNRHEGMVSRFSSMRSMDSIIGDQSNDINTPLPRYSPPHSDSILVGRDGKEIDQRTPRQGDMASTNSGYFQGVVPSSSAQQLANMDVSREVENSTGQFTEKDFWNSSGNHFITSRPASPTTSRFADLSISSIPSSETQRRLDIISQQNDELLEQISQLQSESEEAKRDGGKRQKRLIREIDGLRSELEAAQARTIELERNAEAQKKAIEENQEQNHKKIWRRRGRMPWQNGDKDEINPTEINDENVDSVTNKTSIDEELHSDLKNNEKNGDVHSISGRSESSLSVVSKPRMQTEGERAIVAQLMAKVRELEEINMSLIQDAHERDGRIGRFLEDSERLRDMYDAVENEANSSTFSPSTSIQDLTIAAQQFSPISSAAASPASKRRRAAGNRHLIENRRMVRAAMRNESDTYKPSSHSFDSRSDESAYNSSNNSSLNSSPVKSRKSKKFVRPRILITPSCEDLNSRSQADHTAGWLDDDSESDQTQDQMVRSSSDPTLYDGTDIQTHEKENGRRLLYRASESQLGSKANIAAFNARNIQRSLGSELENVYGNRYGPSNDDAPQQDGEDYSESPGNPLHYKSPRKSASHASLRSVSDAGSDIADLKWSNGSTLTLRTDYDLPEFDMVPSDLSPTKTPTKQMARVSQSQSLSQIVHRPDGEWHSHATQNLLPLGSLRNDVETSHENYSILEKFTRNVPVHWADDEDFGKPITEREAIQLGLLENNKSSFKSSRSKRVRGMLSWIPPLRSKSVRKDELDTDSKKTISTKRQIETAEDVERREALERLLRAKRKAALHDRILTGQMTTEEARRKGAFDDLEDEGEHDQSILSAFSFEQEVTRRTLAYRTGRQRQNSNSPFSSPENPSSSQFPRRYSLHDDLVKMETDQRLGSMKKEDSKEAEEAFEFVDHDPCKKAEADYYPLALRDRYRPEIVRQRVHRFSNETITWAMAWATFSIVMVLAFVSAFARGPKRIMSGQQPI